MKRGRFTSIIFYKKKNTFPTDLDTEWTLNLNSKKGIILDIAPVSLCGFSYTVKTSEPFVQKLKVCIIFTK